MQKYDLNDLFKNLRYLDKELLKTFDDESLDDKEYFTNAILSDIYTNCSSLVMNLLANNKNSIGIDYNCRTIIEAFAILKMVSLNKISDEQLKLFRNQYVIVDFINVKKLFNKENSPYKEPIINQYNDVIKDYCKFYNCTKDKLLSSFVDDPNFFLKKTIGDNINFYNLISKYGAIKMSSQMYSFFSIIEHPHTFFDDTFAEKIYEIRDIYIKQILDYVVEFLKHTKQIIFSEKEQGFRELYTNNIDLINNKVNIRALEIVFNEIIQKTCVPSNNIYQKKYFEIIRDLFVDMENSMSLGYKEQVIAKFKAFLEFISVDYQINSVSGQNEYILMIDGFSLSSMLQINECLGANKVVNCFDDELSDIYKEYYKEKYGLNNYSYFRKMMTNNSLYFIDGNTKKSYKSIVKQSLKSIWINEDSYNYVFTAFQIANDFAHAGGYSFNSSDGMWEIMPHECLCLCADYMIFYLLNLSNNVSMYNCDLRFDQFIKFFSELSNMHRKEKSKIEHRILSQIN